MDVQELVKLYQRSQMGVKLNTEGITHEDSMRRPAGGANCMNWVLGHLVMSRGLVLRAAGAEPVWDRQTSEIYSGHEDVVFDPARALPFERLLTDLESSLAAVVQALSALTPEALAQPLRNSTVAETLTFLAYHEGYHNGQLGLLRRLVGKPGVIKQPKSLSPYPPAA